jgi:hypothetical protein
LSGVLVRLAASVVIHDNQFDVLIDVPIEQATSSVLTVEEMTTSRIILAVIMLMVVVVVVVVVVMMIVRIVEIQRRFGIIIIIIIFHSARPRLCFRCDTPVMVVKYDVTTIITAGMRYH